MLGIYACDVDAIAVMSNAVNDCHLPEDCHHHQADRTILRIHTESRKSLKISYVSCGVVRRYPFVLNPLVSIEAIHLESGQQD